MSADYHLVSVENVLCKGSTANSETGDSTGGTPFKALVRDANGHAFFLTSDHPIPCDAGDNLHLHAKRIASGKFSLPDTLQVQKPANGQLTNFRTKAHQAREKLFSQIDQEAARPEILLWLQNWLGGIKRAPEAKRGFIIEKMRHKPSNNELRWAIDLMGGISDNNITLFDPFAAARLEKRGLNAKVVREGMGFDSLMKRMQHMMIASMPVGLIPLIKNGFTSPRPDMRTENFARDVITGSAITWPQHTEKTPRQDRHGALIMPFSPYETSSLEWYLITNLPANHFVPKHVIEPQTRHRLTIAHELAHALEDDYDIHCNGTEQEDDNLRECFADAFSALAVIREQGNCKEINLLRARRYANLFSYESGSDSNFSHMTGRALDEAVRLGQKLHREGKLANMSTEELLTEASKIARASYLEEEEMDKISQALDQLVGKAEKKYKGQPPPVALFKMSQDLITSNQGHRLFGMNYSLFEKAVKGLSQSAWCVDELNDPGTMKKALGLYRKDLTQTLDYAGGDFRSASMIAAREYATLLKQDKYLDEDLLKAKADILHDLIKHSPHPSPDHLPARSLFHPVPQRSAADGFLGKLFALSPEKRVQLFIESMHRERMLIKQSLGGKKIMNDLETLWNQQCDLAWSLRIDGAAWADLKKQTPTKLLKFIESEAIAKEPNHLSYDEAMQRRLAETGKILGRAKRGFSFPRLRLRLS